jgi:hypothetical protein
VNAAHSTREPQGCFTGTGVALLKNVRAGQARFVTAQQSKVKEDKGDSYEKIDQ